MERTLAERELILARYRQRVLKAARRLIGRARDFLELDDLVTAGLLALDKAITQFDPSRGVKFEHFANSRIRYGMLKEIDRVRCPEVPFSNVIESGDDDTGKDIDNQREVSDTGFEDRLVSKQFWKKVFEDCLTIRERRIVRAINWDRQTVEEVADELGLARPWVSEIYNRALRTLKDYLTEHGLDATTILSIR